MLAPNKVADSRLATLVGEVAYGGTKEAVRVLLAACFAIVMTNPRPGSWAERAKVVGAVLLLVVAAYLFALRLAAHAYEADVDELILDLYAQWRAPPPSPPPTPLAALVRSTQKATERAVSFGRAHPFQLLGIAGSLFLADLLNLAITLDRLDPLVRLPPPPPPPLPSPCPPPPPPPPPRP